jgi:secreted trypsin-like serine protease
MKRNLKFGVVLLSTLLVGACAQERSSESGLKIINGIEVTSDDPIAKHVVAFATSGGVTCTGTLIKKDKILTAAHCLMTRFGRKNWVSMGLGVVDSSDVVSLSYEGQQHPDFHPDAAKYTINDVAIVTIDPDKVPDFMEPVDLLPEGQKLRIGEAVTLAGYGLIINKRFPSENVSNSESKLYKTETNVSRFDEKRHLVIYQSEDGVSSACSGDSGGPMFVKRGGRLYLAAITRGPILEDQQSIKCRGRGTYTDLAPHLTWISEN